MVAESTSIASQQCSDLGEQRQRFNGPILEVVLPFQQPTHTQSGVDLLLREESLYDVDGYLASRANPSSKALEAEKLLSDQQHLGFNFDQQPEEIIGRMVVMEDRDREEAAKHEVSSRPQ
jgi:hypothetical protein